MAFDLVDFTDRYKSHFVEFHLDPQRWKTFSTPHILSWVKIRFSESNQPLVPTLRGVYTFTVEHAHSKFPSHGYILYAGISGDTSNANLRRRYGQYLQHQKTGKGRPAVTYMLQKWPEDLFFSFCPLPDPTIELSVLETG